MFSRKVFLAFYVLMLQALSTANENTSTNACMTTETSTDAKTSTYTTDVKTSTYTTDVKTSTYTTDTTDVKTSTYTTDTTDVETSTYLTSTAPMTTTRMNSNNSVNLEDNETEDQASFNYRGMDAGYTDLSLDIGDSYESSVIPYCEGSDKVTVTIDMVIRQLINLDEPEQILVLSAWMRWGWFDCNLVWNVTDYNGTNKIILPIESVWMPDISLYESVAEEFFGLLDYRAIIHSDGTVRYTFPTKLETFCQLDVSRFPFDSQICTLTFGSWVHNGFEIDVTSLVSKVDLSQTKENAEWSITKGEIVRHEVIYGCCPEPYPDVTVYVYMKRKPTGYVINIIIPSMLVTSIAILGFILPVDSGEKIGLQLTVMLTISVFQMLVAEKLPPSADVEPLISTFLKFTLVLSGGSTLMQVLVLNVYYKGHSKMPKTVKYYILQPLSVLTLVPIPGMKNHICKSKPDTQLVKLFHGMTGRKSPSNDITMEPNDPDLWMYLSVILDRLGFGLFVLILISGTAHIFVRMNTE
ncbi:neuronal acetylcholine receptor subunit alpha-10-like isoform X1 [Mytilus galloprovincialis]|uniref:neuronal acetylcholine receptor subunit alpha-10-like isoform X1 n=1 Tax=Mytilus galloprovincialis TaxID=29158 RepID=UPI003F7B9DCF